MRFWENWRKYGSIPVCLDFGHFQNQSILNVTLGKKTIDRSEWYDVFNGARIVIAGINVGSIQQHFLKYLYEWLGSTDFVN